MSNPAIELNDPRDIVIDDRGRCFVLQLARITREQWLRYFENIVSLSESQHGKRVDRFDASSARLELVEQALTDAIGYKTADGQSVTTVAGWQQMLPLAHRLAAGQALVDVERGSVPDEELFVLGREAVYINAVWGSNDAHSMQKYHGLCHRFKTPTSEHQRRYARDANRSVIIGGSRRGTTRWLGAQATLVELYDELIVSVEGYKYLGSPLPDVSTIVSVMDTYHKVAAAEILFSPAQPDIEEEK